MELNSQTKQLSSISSELISLDNDLLITNSENNQVAVRITATDLDPLLPDLTNLGFEILGIAPEFNIIEGFINIDELSSLEDLASEELLGVIPLYQPITNYETIISSAENHSDLISIDEEIILDSITSDQNNSNINIFDNSINNISENPVCLDEVAIDDFI